MNRSRVEARIEELRSQVQRHLDLANATSGAVGELEQMLVHWDDPDPMDEPDPTTEESDNA